MKAYIRKYTRKKHGISIKIVDGNERAVYPVIIHLLRQLGVLNKTELENLEAWTYPKVKDHKGAVIGNILPVIDIEKPFVPDLATGQRIEFENETLWS